MKNGITDMVVCDKCLVVIATFQTKDGKKQLFIPKDIAIIDIDKSNNKANVICPNCGNKVPINLAEWAHY